ncbi:MAG: FAD-binding protein, partial [Synergistaceae bacterium]|nr:FAD-binding protein [Synergistaceae bacterium]
MSLQEFVRSVTKNAHDIQILDKDEDRLVYAHGVCPYEYKWILQGQYRCLPSLVILPGSTEDVCEVIKSAGDFGIGLIPFGGGSGSVGGTTPERSQVIVDLRRLRDFSLNEINCTATGGAGIIGAEFEDML